MVGDLWSHDLLVKTHYRKGDKYKVTQSALNTFVLESALITRPSPKAGGRVLNLARGVVLGGSRC